uniref:Uncharacterized protein n=3 Tax=Opuntia streptacantha TaxID=393608 RepID=A0A7C9DU10_OPUST
MEAKIADKFLSSSSKKQTKTSNAKAQNHLLHQYHHQQQDAARFSNISRQGNSVNVQSEKKHGLGYAGVFLNPREPLSLSSSLSLPPNFLYHQTTLLPHHHHKHTHQNQPPLLPLPVSKPIFRSLPPHIIRNSRQPPSPLPNRKQTNKTKPKNPNLKRVTTSEPAATKAELPSCEDGLADEPEKHPKDVFSLSPPPSSLPLPKFSMRQPAKLSCTVQAAAASDQIIDDSATDNLCRMLRLQ